jgi:hypothetical protein
MSGQCHAPAALLPGNELQYALDRTLGGPQNSLESKAKGKVPTLTENRNPGRRH